MIKIADIGIVFIPPSIDPIPTRIKVTGSSPKFQNEFPAKANKYPIQAPINNDGANVPPKPPD